MLQLWISALTQDTLETRGTHWLHRSYKCVTRSAKAQQAMGNAIEAVSSQVSVWVARCETENWVVES